jgi:hypothetical protein
LKKVWETLLYTDRIVNAVYVGLSVEAWEPSNKAISVWISREIEYTIGFMLSAGRTASCAAVQRRKMLRSAKPVNMFFFPLQCGIEVASGIRIKLPSSDGTNIARTERFRHHNGKIKITT